MRAREQTWQMLLWWALIGIGRVDIAVRTTERKLLQHQDVALGALPLAWAGAMNCLGAEVYARPARGHAWPVVLLDDVHVDRALAVARKYDAMVVHTSVAGGCHIWLRTARVLAEEERAVAQRWLACRIDADPASTSGEHFGRMAGFKNCKRGGTWVNTLVASVGHPVWDPSPALRGDPRAPSRSGSKRAGQGAIDQSPSGQDWAWLCAALEKGVAPDALREELAERARPRRGADAERYAARSVEAAINKLRIA